MKIVCRKQSGATRFKLTTKVIKIKGKKMNLKNYRTKDAAAATRGVSMFRKLIITAVLMTSIQSFAGQDGNGGFGLDCGGKVQLLDLYEAQARYKYNVNLGPANLSVDQKFEIMMKRLDRINSRLADRYREQYKNLWSMAEILMSAKIIKNDDTLVASEIAYELDVGTTIYPENCSLIPLARNVMDNTLDKNIYFIGKYWNKIDNDNKAALILHELMYFDFLSKNLNKASLGRYPYTDITDSERSANSQPLRQIIALLASKQSETLPLDKIMNIILSETMGGYDYRGYNYNPIIYVQINDEVYWYVYKPELKLNVDGNYFEEVNGVPYSYKTSLQLWGYDWERSLEGNKFIYFDRDSPSKTRIYPKLTQQEIDSEKPNPKPIELHYVDGKAQLTLRANFVNVSYWSKNQIRSISTHFESDHSAITSINLPLFGEVADGKLKSIAFSPQNNLEEVEIFNTSTQMMTKQFSVIKNLKLKYSYEGQNIKEIFIGGFVNPLAFVKANRNLKGKFATDDYTTYSRWYLLLHPNGNIKCMYLRDRRKNATFKAKINNIWTDVNKKTVEFDINGNPFRVGCDVSPKKE